MRGVSRRYLRRTGVPVDVTTEIPLNSIVFNHSDTVFNLSIVPESVGTGTFSVLWSNTSFPTIFTNAVDIHGENIVINFADPITNLSIKDMDIHALKLTPLIPVVGPASYSYALDAV